ncbi:MAG TPA: N-acetylneuraminate synthase [Aggregatilineales bacterium]|nr:N-acetylneuraminate synthase [Aggregatilineales bacterium]
MKTIEIAGRKIGTVNPCFVIAEAGVNHNGDMQMARRLIDAARDAGADAVKFQTFKTEKLVTVDAPRAEYQIKNTGTQDDSQFAMLKRLELDVDSHQELIAYCRERGILFLSSAFDEESADLLVKLDTPAFKVGSGELTNLPFLAHMATYGKPMIVSTGMANLGEVEIALDAITDAGNPDVILLHCLSSYPADPVEVNLRAMHTMQTAFDVPVGYSDHTMGNAVSLAAVAMGACIIEKHLTLDRSLPGPDHSASSEPEEFKKLVDDIRTIESAFGDGRKKPAPGELDTARVARKSLVAARDIATGEILTENMIAIKRPGNGLPPMLRPYLIGRMAKQAIPAGTLLTLEMLA